MEQLVIEIAVQRAGGVQQQPAVRLNKKRTPSRFARRGVGGLEDVGEFRGEQ